jgi:decaprenylphospho-beta-D-ribofuranose 2-oxidase
VTADLAGWGRYPRHHSNLLAPYSIGALCALRLGLDNYVARGAGRAYGDAGVGLGSTVAMRGLNRMRDFDPESGLLTVEAGVTLEEVIDVVLPRGWFVPAVPGTRFVTVGGMIAADVHGKNHHRTGGFGAHVVSLALLPPRGKLVPCSRSENSDLFRATIGGMGLTGAIVEATIRLIKVETGWIRQKTVATQDLDSTFAALAKAEAEATYSVAWIDITPGRRPLGRGVVFLGEHARAAELPEGKPILPPRRASRLSIPIELPEGLVNRWSVGAFNTLYHGKAALSRDAGLARWDSYFFPLDAVGDWNRAYGRSGFLQHQCVAPWPAAPKVVAEIVHRVAAAGFAPFPTVLKSLGAGTGDLSFPMPGLTLTFDLPVTPKALRLLDELDRIVVAAGGRLYLAKDARQSRDTFRAGYLGLAAFETLRREVGATGRLTSHLSARLAIQ